MVFDIDREEVVLNEALEDAQARGVVFDVAIPDLHSLRRALPGRTMRPSLQTRSARPRSASSRRLEPHPNPREGPLKTFFGSEKATEPLEQSPFSSSHDRHGHAALGGPRAPKT